MKIIRTTFCAAHLLLNTSMLLTFFVRRNLRTSFTVYIMCLLFSNIVYAGAEHPFEILFQTYKSSWMWPSLCGFYLYLFWVWCGVPMHIHMLITINRIWAIAMPHTYRKYHTMKMAFVLCGLTTLYVHTVALPLIVLDQWKYAVSVKEKGCTLNFSVALVDDYTTGVQILIFDVPIVVVVLSYPFLLYKQTKRSKRKWLDEMTKSVVNRVQPSTRLSGGAQSGATETAVNKAPQEKAPKKESARPFLVLTLLTTSVFLLWTPNQTYWTVVCFVPPTWDAHAVPIRNIVSAMGAFQPVLDPVLFALSLQSFRTGISRFFRACQGNA
ncbi:D(1C) dopamine receptor-like [Paramacrobiotus metropolitanus]|uniref:D(1C) dopamine receptor-like n=1 Tax=Paramacrobiotus metropolitanus TaxID=2943436 RepID=UPI0024460095|nr:D(1C) dopamine receptor-like [Paramacrobiotus metropolitanus]